jgi:hypothetical protein
MLENRTAASAVRRPAVDLRAPLEGDHGFLDAPFMHEPAAETMTAAGGDDGSFHV